MDFLEDPEDVDLVVGPSILTERSKTRIAEAIAQYKKTGKKMNNVEVVSYVSKSTKNKKSNSIKAKKPLIKVSGKR